MPIPKKYLADFEEGGIYHVYNRTNNKEKLFLSDENRNFFLRRYKEMLSEFTDTYCWCLLPNHFHFLVKIKSENNIKAALQNKNQVELSITEHKFLRNEIRLGELIEHAFKRFFQSYALAFNKMYNRKGNLFYRSFKRILIEKASQFTMAIIYIHANAVKHELVKEIKDYKWSSWHTILSEQPTLLARNEVIEWFGGLEVCIKTHKELTAYYYDCAIAIED